jgi:NAD(P)-dependent dehydrogenase (short-subunit alcohol dehydrogenase family)
MDVKGKTAVVTGAGSGIGRGIALALARHGANVVAADIQFEQAAQIAEDIRDQGGQAEPCFCDVSDELSVSALADFAWSRFQTVELFFNNAGVHSFTPGLAASSDDLRWLFEVNVFGAWYGASIFGQRFLKAGTRGWICTTASENSLGMSSIGAALYTGTKHAILGIFDVLRHEYGEKIGFSMLCPSAVNTAIWDSGRNRPAKHGGTKPGLDLVRKAMDYGLDPLYVGELAIAGVENEEFLIITHPHTRAVAEQRFADIASAIDRQWPDGPGPQHHSSTEIQAKLFDGDA